MTRDEPRPCEYCTFCNNETGRAGAGDGSIYVEAVLPFSIDSRAVDVGEEIGPLCEECFGALRQLMVIED